MPIKPENKARYPKDWDALSKAAKDRAGWCCVHAGCTARNYAAGHWVGEAWRELAPPAETFAQARQNAADQQFSLTGDDPAASLKVIVIVLTTAHLDHDPTNCAPENLAPMCQRHHLRYDQQHHNETAYATRRARANTMELSLS